ncbi:NB-ARC domain-containing protein [candidate division KSB1 bacterium]|nr:NB-ARC domain-containing protein [candidate division KSB1 bacterium]
MQHNLPHRGDFIGREKEKKQVHEALKSRSFITTIDGIGGIGKTSLALEVLHECLVVSQNSQLVTNGVQKFDAFIWTSARDRELTINDVLDTIARTLEYPFLAQLSHEEKRHEIVKRLQEKPCLLIVDNFETVTDDAVQDFVLNLPEPSKCLITSRTQSLRQARAVSLRGMEKEEALLVIKNESGRLGINLEALIANERNFLLFYKATGGAPLAIRWSIGQIKQRGQSIEGVLNSLYGARGDIFEIIFQRAWSLLSESSRQILMIMPVFAASASKAAIEAASDVHGWDLDEGLGQLVELWLLEASEKLDESKRRYSLHPLTRFFAQNQLNENQDLERQARVRLAEFFESFARVAGGDKWLWERYDEIEDEKDNIFVLIAWCFENHEEVTGMNLTKAVTYFMSIRGYPNESKFFGQKALDCARKHGRTNDLAWLLVHGIGWREINGGDLDNGEAMIREGLTIYESSKDSEGILAALHNLTRTLRFKSDIDSAFLCYERGIALAETLGNKLKIALFKREWSMLAAAQGRLVEAKAGLESILPMQREIDAMTFVTTLAFLADVNLQLNLYDSAFQVGTECLELAKHLKKREIIAQISRILAYVETHYGNYQSAISLAQSYLEFYHGFGAFTKNVEEVKTLINELQEKLAA